MNPGRDDVDVLLFDLGGVLIELTGVAAMMNWSSLPEDELWSRWLHSEAVRRFESGAGTADEFAAAVIAEFDLSVDEAAFLEAFIAWPRGPYHGAVEMLDELGGFRLACLSNTNHLHWARFEQQADLLPRFDVHFPSHHTGLLKPDLEVYEHVVAELDTAPGRILFFDDNRLNVEAARRAGLQAERVRTPAGVRQALLARRLIGG